MKTKRNPVVEHAKRLQAVRTIEAARDKAAARRAAATAAGVSRRTIRRWMARYRKGTLCPRPLGRTPKRVERETRRGALAAFLILGPRAGVNRIRGMFHDIPYRQIGQLKKRLWHAVKRRTAHRWRRLIWRRVGAAWSMDFSFGEGKLPEGTPRFFAVSDLASHKRLACVACPGERASVVMAVLTVLIGLYGAPLVMKHDRGSAFQSRAVQDLLAEHEVTSLPSPARTPTYNGSIERTIGCDKELIDHLAWLAGHGDRWTQRELDLASTLANHTARPWGARGPTPHEAFAARERITAQERDPFRRRWKAVERKALMQRKQASGTMPTAHERRRIRRKAIQHALCKCAYLEVRRGRISTPNSA